MSLSSSLQASHAAAVSAARGASPRVIDAVARASARTGVDFSYLMNKARVESSFDPSAKAKGSSATGLYQFVEKTWLQMVRDHGDKYGLSDLSCQIDKNCQVSDSRLRRTILDLRKDPATAAAMAAEYAAQNETYLEQQVGGTREIGNTELYLAHFLGPGGAAKFLSALDRNPDARAAQNFPQEARANPGIFFNSTTGKARTLEEVYDLLSSKFGSDPSLARADSLPQSSSLSESSDVSPETPSIHFDPPVLSSGFLPARKPGSYGFPQGSDSDRLQQAALLVLTQLRAHEESDRYNS